MAETVKLTHGQKGCNVIREKRFGSPTVMKDGVTMAKEIEFEDKFDNIRAQLIEEVANKTYDVAGDSTTTAKVLAQAICQEDPKLSAAGSDPMELKRGFEAAVDAAVEERIFVLPKTDLYVIPP